MNNENKLTQHNIDIEDALTSPLNCRVSTVNCLDRSTWALSKTEAVMTSRPPSSNHYK